MKKSTGNAIELMRIGLYVFFPVAIFYWFNHPDFFEKYVADERKRLFPDGDRPPTTLEGNKKLRLQLKEERLSRQSKISNK
ncbi:PREDICTED: protein PET100 homolog, mitochondrial-like [Amphimedon queenslandica]|nr:PREDICTED: protein PET100 homolog, mitochondrial-like [Amphimedon queenslandica]|eukprot:XP_003384741.1 PREDICTED: protein PET100 homolog, mitochondrial-like [Amphimedon queenslandica]